MRADRQTDRHDDANSRFSQFCERAFKAKTEGGRDILRCSGRVEEIGIQGRSERNFRLEREEYRFVMPARPCDRNRIKVN